MSTTHATRRGRFASRPSRSTRRSSDLSKKPAEVFAEAEHGPVTVTRRDGEPLVLMAARRAAEMDQLLDSAASFTLVMLHDVTAPVAAMTRVYPWMMALSEADRVSCAEDLRDAALVSFSTGQARRLQETVASWKGTAEAVAAGLTAEPVEWLAESPTVERP